MMKLAGILTVLVVMLAAPMALADVYTYQPTPSDLDDLDHAKAYEWGIDVSDIPDDEAIAGASLLFYDIRNWTTESNDLYVTLLDTAAVGVTEYADSQNSTDYFAGQGLALVHYEDLSTTAQDLTYTFDASEIATLATYAADGVIGLGIDPDCHFYNSGVELQIGTTPGAEDLTAPIPEPAAGSILLGAVGMLLARRKRQ
ncbi:MAG: PEP-CTERM sorting domain-containing protein [Planctomycetota bacterium]